MITIKKNKTFNKSYNQYYTYVFSKILYKIKNYDDAKDLCQEIFTQFYNNFEKIKSPKAWFNTVIYYELGRFYEKRKKENNIINIESLDEEQYTNNNYVLIENKIIFNDLIKTKINLKNNIDEEIFNLVAIENFNYTQTAKLLGITTRQVRYKYKKAILLISKFLNNIGIKTIEDYI